MILAQLLAHIEEDGRPSVTAAHILHINRIPIELARSIAGSRAPQVQARSNLSR